MESEWTKHHHIALCALSLLLVVLAHAILTFVLRRRRLPPKRRYPMAPGALPFLGHALSLADPDEFLAVTTRWANEVGKEEGAYEFSLFGTRWIVLCREDTVMEAMRLRPYKLRRFSVLSDAITSLGIRGIFNAEGKTWAHDRRVVGPALNKSMVDEHYFHHIKIVGKRLVEKWEKEEDVAALTDLSKFSLDIIALSILGMDFDSLNDPDHQLTKDIQDLFKFLHKRILSPVHYWKAFNNLDGGRDAAEKVTDVIRKIFRDCVEDQCVQSKEPGLVTKRKMTFLKKTVDILERNNAKLDEERVVGNLATLILGGRDTTSTSLAVCCWELANDKMLQEELYREISGTDIESLTVEDVMNRFPRLHSFLFEVLRIKGPTGYLLLEPGEEISFQGRVIQPGTVICAMARLSGDASLLEIPKGPNGEGTDQFCAQRWLLKGISGVTLIQPSNKHGGFMPFGHGLRLCPGAHLSKVEALTALICILRTFEIAPIENHPPLRRVSRFAETFDGEIQLTLKLRV